MQTDHPYVLQRDVASTTDGYGALGIVPGVESGWYKAFGKRALDVILVLMALPFALPLIALCAVMAFLDGSRPFYRQLRVGRDGSTFRILKIRTMVPYADMVLKDYLANNPEARKEWNEKQKLCNDPRITRFGRFMRQTSLDELPQLWNVLVGDMSLVGPRPMMVEQQRLYPCDCYYKMRPGISGPWQISDRNESSFADRARFDREYYRDLSVRTDVEILLRTVSVVLRATGH